MYGFLQYIGIISVDQTVLSFLLLSIWVLIIHWYVDFVAQKDVVAINKSKSNSVLARHILEYTLPLVFLIGPYFGLINGLLHWITDYHTSRIVSRKFEAGNRHDAFVWIGVDQLIHSSCLLITLYLLYF